MTIPTAQVKVKKRSKPGRPAGPWITARKAVQYSALLFFIALVLLAQKGNWAGKVLDVVMRLDPLLMLGHALASRTILFASALALILIVLAVVFGRAWCGWLCPLGTVLDIFSLQRLRSGRPAPAEGWRKVKYDLVLVILVAALLGNLTLLFFDPLTILTRTLTVSLLPALDRIMTAIEGALFRIPPLAGPVSAFDAWIRPALLPTQPLFYRDAVLFAAIFLALVLLNLFAARFWCRYLCPLGGFLGFISRIAIFQRRVDEECKGCTLCTNVCPTGTINPDKGYKSDPGECTLCMDCVETCPRGLNSFLPKATLPERNRYDPDTCDALAVVGVAVLGVALFHSTQRAKDETLFLLRPPGARENNPDPVVFTKCIRCGDCMRACPTGVLQPAVNEAGVEGAGTPILITRLGYCDYSCNACGQVCPVQAIPPLALAEKQVQVVGKAFIDQSRCIAWSDRRPCIVCHEMCPLPDKAIWLEDADVSAPDGGSLKIQLPHVIRETCIGCGICEYKCPVGVEAAIRVYSPQGAESLYLGEG